MNEPALLKAALAISVAGLILIYLISSKIEISDTTIEKINQEEIEGTIKLTGYVKSINERNGITQLVITQTSEVDAVVFDSVELEEGSYIELTGELSEYDGDKQIVVETITLK